MFPVVRALSRKLAATGTFTAPEAAFEGTGSRGERLVETYSHRSTAVLFCIAPGIAGDFLGVAKRGRSISVICVLPKHERRVRLPPPAPSFQSVQLEEKSAPLPPFLRLVVLPRFDAALRPAAGYLQLCH